MEYPDRPRVVRLNAETFPVIAAELETLSPLNAELVQVEGVTDQETLMAARDADAIMVISAYLGAEVIRQLRRCRVISRLGTGVDKIAVEEATRRGIPVAYLPDFCTEEVADHTMALLLAAARQLKRFEIEMRRGRQPHDVPHMHRLCTRTLGIVGFGRIGRAVARRAGGFGMRVLTCDPAVSPDQASAAGATLVELPALLAESDYVCLLCPLSDATRGMLGMRELRMMKPTAVLVNTGRGELVDEAALVTALKEGLIRYAALDVYAGINVFAPGGFPTDHPLFDLENVLLTPHVAACSEESLLEQRVQGAQAVVDVLSGRWPAHVVNPQVVPWFPLRR